MKRFTYLLSLSVGLSLILGMAAFRPVLSSQSPSFVSKAWKVQSIKLDKAVDFNGDGQPDTELKSFMDACSQDDVLIFEPNSNLTTDKGNVHCRENEPATELTGHWIYESETQVISLVDLKRINDTVQWQVVESSASILKVRFDILPSDGRTSLQAIMTLQAR